MPRIIIYNIAQDNHPNYGITTSHGLVRMEYHNRKMKIFTQQSGLLNNQFNYQSIFKDDEGTI
ncbi:hypothetical protein [Niabella digestorum]|uniref:Uncharacterized protein n=1 Tax=Niabella digestorum TaxID=3117701 RepID=A0ABU7RGG6_9BACT